MKKLNKDVSLPRNRCLPGENLLFNVDIRFVQVHKPIVSCSHHF